MKYSGIFTSVVIFSFVWEALGDEDDVNLTPEQKQKAMDEFKGKVISKLPEAFMRDDVYLTRFLTAQDWDVSVAEELILENVKWREENNMTTIHLEDFSDIEADFKAYIDGTDKEGRPIMSGNFGDWDLRKAVATGRMKRLERYVDRLTEMVMRRVRELQAGGKTVSQFDKIVNLNNYNEHQHGCPQCLPFYIYVTNSYERRYPGSVYRTMLVNTPPKFQIVLDIIMPLMSKPTRQVLKVYNHDKTTWGPEVLKLATPENLLVELGGTKV